MRTKISGKHFKVGALVLVCAILMQLSSGLFVSAQGEAGDSGQNRALNSGGYAGFDLTNAAILQADSGIALGSGVNEANPIQLQYKYNIANVAEGDTYTFNLPKEVLVKDSGKLQQQVFAVLDSGKEIIANGTIATDTNEVKLVFTDKAADVTDAVFSINTDVYFNAPRLMLDGKPDQTIRFKKANGVQLNDVKVNFLIDKAFDFFAETSSGEPFIVLAIDGKDPTKVDIKDVKKDAKIAVKYNFKMPEAAVKTVHPLVPYYFNLPPQTKAQALPLKFDIKNGNTVVAQGVIGGDSNKPNEATVTFNEHSYGDLDNPNDPNNILYPGTEGEMHFELLFDAGKVGNGGRQDIVFSTPTHGQEVTIPVDFKVDPVTAKLDMAKGATPSFSALNNMSIAWEVKATAQITDPGNPNVTPAVLATVSGVVITDAIESPLVYDDKTGVTVKHYKSASDKSPTTVSGSTVSLDTATTPNYTLKVVLPSGSTLKDGEYYTISYNTTFDFDAAYAGAGADKKIRFSNTAAAAFSNTQYIKDTTTGENKGKTLTITEPSKEKPQAKKDVELVADFIDKAGALKNGKIDWTVTIKPQSCVFNGGEITDVIPVGLTLENGSVKWNGTAVTEDTTTKPTTTPEHYSYVKTAGGTGAFTYVMKNAEVKTDQRLTYTTTVDSGYDKLTNEFINNAGFYPTDGPASGFSKVAKVHYGNSVSSKSVGAYVPSVHTLPWTITIGENGGTELANPVVTDMLPNTLTMLNDTITVNGTKLTLGGGSVDLGDNVSVELTQGSTSGSAMGYVFTFTGTVKKQYSIKFNTTVNDDKYWAANTNSTAAVSELQNTATLKVEGHENNPVSATPSVPSQILAKSVPKAYDYNTKKAFWQITVNQNKMAMIAPTIVDTLDTAGLTFDVKSIVVTQGNTTVTPTSITLGNDGGTPAKPTITVVLPDMAAGNEPYVVSYATNVSDKILMNITDKSRTVKNTAVLSSSTFKTPVSVQAEQKVASPLITKIGKNSPGDYSIEWKIMVNQNLAEMQAPLLTDELAEELTLNPDSIKLEKLTIGTAGNITKAEDVTDTAADYKAVMNGTTQTFTVKFKDKITTAYWLTFKTFCKKDATYGNAVSVISNGVTLKTDETKTTSSSSSAGGQTRPILGQLKLTKTDTTGNPLVGAEFTLGKVVKTTDEKGEALFDGIRNGTYYVTETKAPKGYVLPAAPDNKTMIEVGETTAGFVHTKEIKNEPVKGKLVVTKTDSADLNKKLAGAEFSVTKAGDTSFSKTLTTNSVGAAELNDLAIGSYTVTETKAPVGYLLNTTPQSFEVKDTSDNSQVTTPFKLSFSNKMISGKLVVTKTDDKTGAKLAGAKFKVERTASEAAAPPFATLTGATALTTGADGTATLANIPIGSYKVTEEAAPAGYMLDESKLPYTFTVLNNNAQPTADFAYSLSNKKGDGIVEITKTDKSSPTKKLTGAVFTAVEATTKQEYASTEAADGVYVINLPAGTYDITETTAPMGYVKNYTKHLTVASANGGTPVKQSFSATNEGISGKLVVTKTDSADLNKKLAGAEFNVTKAGDTSFSKKITTGTDGTARLTGLSVGSYTVTESKAPAGYVLNT
ncbi:MAG: SpaA isopeptide-forming pilin-related protein, partial [Hydrogenoanaerobacterium sp.]